MMRESSLTPCAGCGGVRPWQRPLCAKCQKQTPTAGEGLPCHRCANRPRTVGLVCRSCSDEIDAEWRPTRFELSQHRGSEQRARSARSSGLLPFLPDDDE